MTQLLIVKLINSEVRVSIRVSGKTRLRSLLTQCDVGSRNLSACDSPGETLLTGARGRFAQSREKKG